MGLLQLRPWKPRFVGFLGTLASAINCYMCVAVISFDICDIFHSVYMPPAVACLTPTNVMPVTSAINCYMCAALRPNSSPSCCCVSAGRTRSAPHTDCHQCSLFPLPLTRAHDDKRMCWVQAVPGAAKAGKADRGQPRRRCQPRQGAAARLAAAEDRSQGQLSPWSRRLGTRTSAGSRRATRLRAWHGFAGAAAGAVRRPGRPLGSTPLWRLASRRRRCVGCAAEGCAGRRSHA